MCIIPYLSLISWESTIFNSKLSVTLQFSDLMRVVSLIGISSL